MPKHKTCSKKTGNELQPTFSLSLLLYSLSMVSSVLSESSRRWRCKLKTRNKSVALQAFSVANEFHTVDGTLAFEHFTLYMILANCHHCCRYHSPLLSSFLPCLPSPCTCLLHTHSLIQTNKPTRDAGKKRENEQVSRT